MRLKGEMLSKTGYTLSLPVCLVSGDGCGCLTIHATKPLGLVK
jgi:hypothetical protein